MPRPLRLALFCLALLAVVLGVLVAATTLIPPRAHAWIALALSIVIALREAIPALWARVVEAPAVEPPRIADAVAKVGVVLLLLCGTAHGNPIAPGVALPPGPEELAAEAQRPQQAPPQPITYAADRGPLQVSPVLLAQLAGVVSNPAPLQPVPVAGGLVSDAALLTDAERAALAIKAAQAGLASAQQGIATAPVLKAWSETRAGQIVMGCIAGAIVVTSAAGSAAMVWVAAR